jgi:cytochrome c oxidase subunit 2
MSDQAQSALEPAGPQASRILDLGWLFLAVSAVVFVLVMAFTLRAASRKKRGGERAEETAESGTPQVEQDPALEKRLSRAVTAAVSVTVVLLFVLLFASIAAGRKLSEISTEDAVKFEIVGHQWWWEVYYRDPAPGKNFPTANEIHIPVGRTVILNLTSRDVIHSLWIPRLHGKRDLIPSRITNMVLRADAPGVYRAQCAEFCGAQHAKMALLVVAEPEEQFEAWVRAQIASAAEPKSDAERRGHDVFLKSSCIICHTVRGTLAAAVVAPDLTHVASRMTLAAGSLPNTPEHRAGWVKNPQEAKPGSNMPPSSLSPADFEALLAYIGSLK